MELDTELSAEDWAHLVERYKQIVQDKRTALPAGHP